MAHGSKESPQEITPDGCDAWCIWNDGDSCWGFGSDRPPHIQIERGDNCIPLVRFRHAWPEYQNGLLDLVLEPRTGGEWTLWVVGVRSDGSPAQYEQQFAWCRWRDASPLDVASFLLKAHEIAFQRGRTHTEICADAIVNEHVEGLAALMMASEEDED